MEKTNLQCEHLVWKFKPPQCGLLLGILLCSWDVEKYQLHIRIKHLGKVDVLGAGETQGTLVSYSLASLGVGVTGSGKKIQVSTGAFSPHYPTSPLQRRATPTPVTPLLTLTQHPSL